MVTFSKSSDDPSVRLMLRFQQGDDAAFDELVMTFQTVLVRYIAREIDDWHAAEDVTQEVFLRVYRSRDRYRPVARFTTWLYHIAGNLISNYRRDRYRRREQFHGDPLSKTDAFHSSTQTPDETQCPCRVAERNELCIIVRQAVRRLPKCQCQAVELTRFQGLKRAETARRLNRSTAAVKGLLARAKYQLRHHLSGCFRDEPPQFIRYAPLPQRPIAASPHSNHDGSGAEEGGLTASLVAAHDRDRGWSIYSTLN